MKLIYFTVDTIPAHINFLKLPAA